MANLSGTERARYVQAMFARLARRYDRMNRLMTFGQDMRWRKEVIQRAQLPQDGRLLDIGAGTGDLARQALKQFPSCRAVAADFTLEMMQIGQQRTEASASDADRLSWCGADAHQLPFPQASFDAVVSGYLLRNVSDRLRALQEQHRVLRPGGWVVVLDTSPPRSMLAPLIRFYLHRIIPLLGRLITGQAEAYRYLPDSTESFLEPEQLADLMKQAGFTAVGFRLRMFGTMAIHWGRKPEGER